MGGAGTADAIEGDDVIDPEPAGNARVWSRDAYRQCSPGDPKCSPTKFEHFRHERQMVRCSLGVQRLDDFVRRLRFAPTHCWSEVNSNCRYRFLNNTMRSRGARDEVSGSPEAQTQGRLILSAILEGDLPRFVAQRLLRAAFYAEPDRWWLSQVAERTPETRG